MKISLTKDQSFTTAYFWRTMMLWDEVLWILIWHFINIAAKVKVKPVTSSTSKVSLLSQSWKLTLRFHNAPMMMANHDTKVISSASEILDWQNSHTWWLLTVSPHRYMHGATSASITTKPAFLIGYKTA